MIERGLADARAGRTISHEEMKKTDSRVRALRRSVSVFKT